MKTLAVVGAGTMGRGIAQLAVQSGLDVHLFDVSEDALELAKKKIRAGLEKGVSRGKLTSEEAEAAFGRLSVCSSLEVLKGDFVIEAVSENLDLKQGLFKDLGRIFPAPTLLATNTSSIAVSDIARSAASPERVVGMHFFNPPVAMKLVEVIRHETSSEEAVQAAMDLATSMKRTPVLVKDTPGFLVNRVVRSYYLVAQRLAAEGVGDYATIDQAIKRVGKLPMGPFTLMDFIGLEVNFEITKIIYEGLGRPDRLKPHSIQEKLVAMGCKGRKSGKGFYLYEEGKDPVQNPDATALLPEARKSLSDEEVFDRILEAIHAEAQVVVETGVAEKASVDTAVKLAMNFPMGPYEWASTRKVDA